MISKVYSLFFIAITFAVFVHGRKAFVSHAMTPEVTVDLV